MKTKWQLKDFVDLEYFLHRDEKNTDESKLAETFHKDREFFLDHIKPMESEGKTLSQKNIIKSWLEYRKTEEEKLSGPDKIFPGDSFGEMYRILLWSFAVIGGLTGAGMAFSFLIYSGSRPLNVSAYFGVFILTQILFILLFIGFSIIQFIRRPYPHTSIAFTLVKRLLDFLLLKLKTGTVKNLPASQSDSLREIAGIISGKKQVYGSLFYWPVFTVVQVFGIGFNLGILSATLLRVIGTDIAFGWQSTIQFSHEAVYRLVKIAAIPWSWFIPPETAHPSLLQIEGSRIVLKNGITHLATQDMVAWWPFLCFSVLFYGLLPRVIFLIIGIGAGKNAILRQNFDYGSCDQLLRRLNTPIINTAGLTIEARKTDSDHIRLSGNSGLLDNPTPGNGLIVLVPDDIYDEFSNDELSRVISQTTGNRIHIKIKIGEDYGIDRDVLKDLIGEKRKNNPPGLFILQEAWMPPILEILGFIKKIRKIFDEKTIIEVGLIGKPDQNTIFTPVKNEDWNTWKKKLNAIGDPYLVLERLVQDGS